MLTLSLFSNTPGALPLGVDDSDPYEEHLHQLSALITPDQVDEADNYSASIFFESADGVNQSLVTETDGFQILNFTPQIDEGVVTLHTKGQDIGTIWTEVVDPDEGLGHHREHWVVHDASFTSASGAPFEIEMLAPKADMNQAIESMPSGWQEDSYAAIDFTYTSSPSAFSTQFMTYEGSKVERHLFVLVQSNKDPCTEESGVQVSVPAACWAGVMMREHHKTSQGSTFYEHWLFHGNFSMLENEGDSVRLVALKGNTPKHTAFFFSQYNGSKVKFYAQAFYSYASDANDFPL